MTIKALLHIFQQELHEIYSQNEIEAIFYRLSEHFWQIKRIDVSLNPGLKAVDNRLADALPKLKQNEPWQYITELEYFYGLDFKVKPGILIPRPETEELVDWVLQNVRKDDKILDIGTGSGAIAVGLAKNSSGKLTAIDISNEALSVAKENADKHSVDIDFEQLDILQCTHLPKQFDIIVSNPPYVRQTEKDLMHKNVLEFEPEKALFVPDGNPLIFYDKILKLALQNNSREVYFEINEYLKDELTELLKDKHLMHYQFKKDFRGKWRMLRIVI